MYFSLIYCTLFGTFGTAEIVVIVILALLLFGGKKIPELMRGLGIGLKEFKKASNDNYENNNNDKLKSESETTLHNNDKLKSESETTLNNNDKLKSESETTLHNNDKLKSE